MRVYVKPVAVCDEKPFDFLKVFRKPPSYKTQQIFSEIQEPFKGIYLISPVIMFHKHDLITNIKSMSSLCYVCGQIDANKSERRSIKHLP